LLQNPKTPHNDYYKMKTESSKSFLFSSGEKLSSQIRVPEARSGRLVEGKTTSPLMRPLRLPLH